MISHRDLTYELKVHVCGNFQVCIHVHIHMICTDHIMNLYMYNVHENIHNMYYTLHVHVHTHVH